MHKSAHSFDTKGLIFSIKFACGALCLFSVIQYGTAFGAPLISDSTNDAAEKSIAAASMSERAPAEMEVLEKVEEYEQTLATRTIGTASVDTLSRAHTRLIAADLSAMKVYLFENGHATATYPILSKGKRGSRWETPTGLYKIETKEESHFSTIGGVYMPLSMQFFGNFFIHGWPYYPDGTPVSEGYSGGCIRLSTDDARRVFEFAERETPLFVWENHATTSERIVPHAGVPKISAKAFLIADVRSGVVFAENNADTRLPIASLTKLLTALVANETIPYDRVLSISREDKAQTDGTPGSLLLDDSFEAADLIYPLLMESNNSVAYTFARYFGSENFMRWMNDKARAIGMSHTSLEDPSGISEHNVSTANDLFRLTRYIHDSQSFILNVSREADKKITSLAGRAYALGNYNVFASNPNFLGGKTGYTDRARETMTAIFELPIDNATTTVAIIVLGSEDRAHDVRTLLGWFTKNAHK